MGVRVKIKLSTEECHHVLDNKSIIPFFQPIYNTENEMCTGAEILARLPYANNEMLTPEHFLPGMMSARSQRILTGTLLNKTLPLLKNRLLPPGFLITFNISADMIGCSWLKIACDNFLKDSYDKVFLVIEITEREPLTMDYFTWLPYRKSLRKSGVLIALDDFGIGYSNLFLLKQTEAEYIKIPCELVSDIEHNSGSMHIVDSIIQLGNSLNFKVIAEGVETDAQYNALQSKGIVLMQGFYFSPPLCLDDFTQYIKKDKALITRRILE